MLEFSGRLIFVRHGLGVVEVEFCRRIVARLAHVDGLLATRLLIHMIGPKRFKLET